MPTPVSSYAAALSAYAQAAGKASDPPPAMPQAAAASPASFADTLETMLGNAVDAGKASERGAISAVTERNDIQGVVTAVAEAEVALQSVIAIRDRAVEAYKDIMRMPI